MKNREIVESYKITTVRDKIGIYGQRLIVRLCELANNKGAIQGLDFASGKDIRRVDVGLWGVRSVTMPLTDIMNKGCYNYSAAKKAVMALQREIIEYENGGEWVSFSFLGRTKISNGYITCRVEPELWEVFADFTKGFRRFEIETVLQLKSTYSLRLYKLISGQQKPLNWSLDDLKKMLGVEGKYKRPRDFIQKVIHPAKIELDEIAPWGFDYVILTTRTSATGRAKINAIRCLPKRIRVDEDLEKNTLRRQYGRYLAPVKGEARKMLLLKFGFTDKGILANGNLFSLAQDNLRLVDLLDQIAERVARRRPRNVQGYVVKAIRDELVKKGFEV